MEINRWQGQFFQKSGENQRDPENALNFWQTFLLTFFSSDSQKKYPGYALDKTQKKNIGN